MKKKLFSVIVALLVIISGVAFTGCDFLKNSNDNDDNKLPQINNTVDLKEYIPTPDDDQLISGETYYESRAVDLVTEINGNYSIDRPFTLDKENENKRIYHNIYFYVEDYFQVLYYKDVNALGTVYAIMSDTSDQEYAEIEYTDKGSPLQINIKKQGIYNLVLDTTNFAIDMIKVGDITTPVYETIKSCELNIHVSLDNHTYTPMTLNKETNEYYILANIPSKASIGFYSDTHNSHYKMTVENNIQNKLVWYNSTSPSQVQVLVGGTYKVYFNAKTYVLRLELQNPDTASYYCQVGWQENKELTATSNDTPYLFEYEFVAQGKPSDPWVEIPSIYPYLGMPYNLTVLGDETYVAYGEYIKEDGTYKLIINLKDFTLTVEKLS